MRLSVIIPTLNEAALVDRCLSSLAGQDFAQGEMEIIVVDNASTDETPSIVHKHGARYVRETRRGPYACRNTGAQQASGAILAFTDSDCTFYPDWCSRAWRAIAEAGLDAVVGWSEGEGSHPIAGYIQERYERNLSQKATTKPILDTRNCAVSSSAFRQAGGFDERFLDLSDELLGVRLASLGKRVGYDPLMRVRHLNPTTPAVLAAKKRRGGYYCHKVWQSYPHEVLVTHFPGIERWEKLCELRPRLLRRLAVQPFRAAVRTSVVISIAAAGLLPSATILLDYLWKAAHLEGRLSAALE